MNKRIKRLSVFFGALLLSLSLLSGKNANAETLFGDYLKDKGIEVEVSGSVDYYNKYIWRGFTLDKDSVIQPSVTISANGFEVGYWGSFDLQNDDALTSDESDGWIGYSFDLGFIDESLEIVGISVGHTWYAFPAADLYSKETYLGISVDTFLSPYFTWYHDYEDEAQGGADGDYFMFGVGHSFTLAEDLGITLDVGQEIGINDKAFIADNGGYSLTTLALNIPLSENVTAVPTVAYSSPWGDIKDAGNDDEVYGGVSVGFSF